MLSCPGRTLKTSSITALRWTGNPYGPSSAATLEYMSNVVLGAKSASGAVIAQSTNSSRNDTGGDEPRTFDKQALYRLAMGTPPALAVRGEVEAIQSQSSVSLSEASHEEALRLTSTEVSCVEWPDLTILQPTDSSAP